MDKIGNDANQSYSRSLGVTVRGKNNAHWVKYSSETSHFTNLSKTIIKNPIYKWGFIGIDRMASFSRLIELSQGLENEFSLALKNGLQISELNQAIITDNITRRDIEILISRAAIVVYKSNPDIPLKQLLMDTPEKTEMNILRIIAKQHREDENMVMIHDNNIRHCLLSYLHPCLFNDKQLSDLIGHTEEETKQKILAVYLNHYNIKHLNPGNDNTLVTAFLDEIIKYDSNKKYVTPSKFVFKLSVSLSKLFPEKHQLSFSSHSLFADRSENSPIDKLIFNDHLVNPDSSIEPGSNESYLTLSMDMKENVRMLAEYSDNAYDLLGVNPDATHSQIRKAFYNQARMHHPDKHSSSANDDHNELMKYINIAYNVLNDPAGKNAYDHILLLKNAKSDFKK